MPAAMTSHRLFITSQGLATAKTGSSSSREEVAAPPSRTATNAGCNSMGATP